MLITFEQFKTYYRALIQKLKGFRGNWNQNDPTANDYIKNRTHYSEIKEIFFVEEQTISGFSVMQDPIYVVQNPFSFTPVIGNTYTVMWDGESYDCTAYEYESGAIGLGNENYFYMESGGDIPFLILNGGAFVVTESTADSHTISIFNRNEIVHKIDEKYLPKISSVGAEGTAEGAEIFNDYSYNEASGINSHAEGSNNTASSVASHAEGNGTTASGDCSHAEGAMTYARGNYSHAEGNGAEANGYVSHAEGGGAIASEQYSHAEGYFTTASGIASHAEGYHAIASGYISHAEGYRTMASSQYQHVQGKFNIEDTENKYAHIVGNGSNSARSNAHTLDWDGNAWFAGNVTIGTNKEKLITKKDIDIILNSTDILVSNIYMPDQVNGKTYVVQMRNGTLVSMCVPTATITTNPTKMTYYDGDGAGAIDTTGMVLTLTYEDGTTKEITEGFIVSIKDNNLSFNNSLVTIEYRDENNIISSVSFNVTVVEFDPTTALMDFNYADNGNGTYTLTSWKETHNDISSTELIVPDNNKIIV